MKAELQKKLTEARIKSDTLWIDLKLREEELTDASARLATQVDPLQEYRDRVKKANDEWLKAYHTAEALKLIIVGMKD